MVAFVRHAHDEERIALGDDGRINFGRPLRDKAEKNTVLAALLGDARKRSSCWSEADFRIGWRVTVCFFADKEQRGDAIAPQTEIECHTANDGYDRVDDLSRKSGHLHDRHRRAIRHETE